MPEQQLYEYAVIRLVPRVDREEFLNVGVVLYVAGKKFLHMLCSLDEQRIHSFCKDVDVADIREYLLSFERICVGGKGAGALGALPVAQRFRWLAATRSTVLQVSKVHSGFCTDPREQLLQLYGKWYFSFFGGKPTIKILRELAPPRPSTRGAGEVTCVT